MLDTDVVIVGAGPTGLMMACQLLRYNVRFRIVDKQLEGANESRALVIHAKSMELLQNLGLAPQFLSKAKASIGLQIFVKGQLKSNLNFKGIGEDTTPFPSVYFLSQAETEKILSEHLANQGVHIERGVEISSFHQHSGHVTGQFFHQDTQEYEDFSCRYLIGCDGAHSKVRHILNFKFEGAPYFQEFVLADLQLEWPYDRNKLSVFLSESGALVQFPLNDQISRLIISQSHGQSEKRQVSLQEVESLMRQYIKVPFRVSNPVWLSRFHLSHRIVPSYRERNVFLAGDAAHIHSPAGGQGMNTGLQDASNLAWKMALVIKGVSPEALLETYNQERHPIGVKLLKTTDRFFTIATSGNPLVSSLRNFLIPITTKFVFSAPTYRKRAFRFVSELGIRYHENAFLWERKKSADSSFGRCLPIGSRAPDCLTEQGDLFEMLKGTKAHVFIFDIENGPLSQIRKLKDKYKGLIHFHHFRKNQKNLQLFQRYGVEKSAIYFIRPDGYIGFRCEGQDFAALSEYLEHLCPSVPLPAQALPREAHSYLNF